MVAVGLSSKQASWADKDYEAKNGFFSKPQITKHLDGTVFRILQKIDAI